MSATTDVFLACYARFGESPFTRKQARKITRKPGYADAMISNGMTYGHLCASGRRPDTLYQFTPLGIARVDALTKQPTPVLATPPPHVEVGSKDPAAILRTIRKQLEDQIDQIDEALETLRMNDTAVANIEKIRALLS